MFDFAWSEIALIGVVALIAIGPKDMPVAIKAISEAIKRARRMASEFQTHVDDMVREANLGEVRDQIRDIRSLDIKGTIARAVDNDGTLRRALNEDPTRLPPPPVAPTPTILAPASPAAPETPAALEMPAFVPPTDAAAPHPAPAPAAPPAFIPPDAARPADPVPGPRA